MDPSIIWVTHVTENDLSCWTTNDCCCIDQFVCCWCENIGMFTVRMLYHSCNDACLLEFTFDWHERWGWSRQNKMPAKVFSVGSIWTCTLLTTWISRIFVSRLEWDGITVWWQCSSHCYEINDSISLLCFGLIFNSRCLTWTHNFAWCSNIDETWFTSTDNAFSHCIEWACSILVTATIFHRANI